VPTPVGPVPLCPGRGVQFVGWVPVVGGGRHICQFTVVVVDPVAAPLNCCVPRSTTVTVVGEIVTPMGVELPPHPATKPATKIPKLNFQRLIRITNSSPILIYLECPADRKPECLLRLNEASGNPLDLALQNRFELRRDLGFKHAGRQRGFLRVGQEEAS
jgi:hypothetical protein